MKKDGTIEKAFVVVNPASGKAEPILHILNEVFKKHEVEWEVGVTHKYGDAKMLVQDAVKGDYDVIIGYGGDGTQHEVVEGLQGSDKLMGILPGGTGNGFAAGLDIPKVTQEALEMLCTTTNVINVDIATVNDTLFLSRLYTGIDPEDQTSREMKDKYGVFAYAVGGMKRRKKMKPVHYTLVIDGKTVEGEFTKCYVVNSASTGVGIDIGEFLPTDGLLDLFLLNLDLASIGSFAERVAHIHGDLAKKDLYHGVKIEIETDPIQSVWADGEYIGKTPIKIELKVGGLRILAEKPKKHKV